MSLITQKYHSVAIRLTHLKSRRRKQITEFKSHRDKYKIREKKQSKERTVLKHLKTLLELKQSQPFWCEFLTTSLMYMNIYSMPSAHLRHQQVLKVISSIWEAMVCDFQQCSDEIKIIRESIKMAILIKTLIEPVHYSRLLQYKMTGGEKWKGAYSHQHKIRSFSVLKQDLYPYTQYCFKRKFMEYVPCYNYVYQS